MVEFLPWELQGWCECTWTGPGFDEESDWCALDALLPTQHKPRPHITATRDLICAHWMLYCLHNTSPAYTLPGLCFCWKKPFKLHILDRVVLQLPFPPTRHSLPLDIRNCPCPCCIVSRPPFAPQIHEPLANTVPPIYSLICILKVFWRKSSYSCSQHSLGTSINTWVYVAVYHIEWHIIRTILDKFLPWQLG